MKNQPNLKQRDLRIKNGSGQETKFVFFNNLSMMNGHHVPKTSPPTQLKIAELRRLAIENCPSFYDEYNKVYPNFRTNLMKVAPFINLEKQKICAYLRLGFTTKETAHYTNTSERSVEGRRYRMRKDFKLKQKENLVAFLSTL